MWRWGAFLALLLPLAAYAGISAVVVPVSAPPCTLSTNAGGCMAAVPHAGFNTWPAQALTPTQTYMTAVSDYIVSSGLQTAWGGTVTAGIDEGWPATSGGVVTRSSGNVVPSANFSSMTTLTAHIKANGQVPMLYRDGGQVGCQGEDWGASTLASDITYFNGTLGFQGLKIDGCGLQTPSVLGGRTAFGNAETTLVGLGLPYVYTYGYANGTYSGYTQTWAYGPRTGTAWRTSFDVNDIGYCITTFARVENNIWATVHHPGVVGPYHFPDADFIMAQDGTGSLTTNEAVTQIAMWAVLSSPWIIGCDPRPSGSGGLGAGLGTTEMAALKNTDLIAIQKDPWVYGGRRLLGHQDSTFGAANTWEYFCKRLSGTGKRAIAIINQNDLGVGAQTITVDPTLCGINTANTYDFKNVLTGTTTTGHTGTFSTGSLAAHATGIFLLTNGTDTNDTCWATNPGGAGQIADGFAGGCAFTADNNGNPAGGFPADGTTTTTATAISTTGLTNPAAQGCYQKQRKGSIATDDPNEAPIEYLADNLQAGATYHYRIHLAETEGKTTGQRLWNLTINTGAQRVAALTSEDIYVDAGSTGNKAVIKEGNIVADHGYLSFDFEPLNPPTGVPTVGCIEVIKQ